MNEQEKRQIGCHHQTTDEDGFPFNFCPWCGQRLNNTVKDVLDGIEDDCIKGGCND